MSAIGILGGMGPQASARLYELLIEGTKVYTPAAVDNDYPEIVLLNVPVPNFISNKNNLQEAKQMLIERTQLLEQAGCNVIGIACNTAHLLLPDLQVTTKVPFLSIPRLVAKQVETARYNRVGLFATPTTIASNLYDEALEDIAEVVKPNSYQIQNIERYVYQKLSGNLTELDRSNFKKGVRAFKRLNKLDAVILGCTELPLIYGESMDEEAIIDSLQILSKALLDEYFKNKGDDK